MRTAKECRDELANIRPDIPLVEGFEDAIIGYAEIAGGPPVALYDKQKCLEIVAKETMSWEDAEEHFYNILNTDVGEDSPVFATILWDV